MGTFTKTILILFLLGCSVSQKALVPNPVVEIPTVNDILVQQVDWKYGEVFKFAIEEKKSVFIYLHENQRNNPLFKDLEIIKLLNKYFISIRVEKNEIIGLKKDLTKGKFPKYLFVDNMQKFNLRVEGELTNKQLYEIITDFINAGKAKNVKFPSYGNKTVQNAEVNR